MPDWQRSTREVSLEGLMPEIVSAVNAHIELYNLGPILADTLTCIQTDSVKSKKGLFGKQENVSQGAIVTPHWLVWVVVTGSTSAAVLSAQLSNVTVQDYAQTPYAKMVPDSGIQVNGMFTGVSENASAFIGLDDGAAAKKFKEIVFKAAQDAKK